MFLGKKVLVFTFGFGESVRLVRLQLLVGAEQKTPSLGTNARPFSQTG